MTFRSQTPLRDSPSDGEGGRLPEKRRRRRKAMALATLLAAGAIAMTWALLPSLAERLAAWRLSAMFGAPAELEIARLGLDGAVVTGLSVGDSLSADAVTIAYDPLALLGGRVAAVTVSGARLAGEITGDGVRLGPLALAAAGGGSGDISVGRIAVTDSSAQIRLGDRSVTLPFSLQAELGPEGGVTGTVAVEGPLRFSATIARRGDTITVTSDEGLALALDSLPPGLADRLPEALRGLAGGPLEATVGGLGDRPLEVRIAMGDGAATVATALRIAARAAGAALTVEADGTAEVLADGLPRRLDIRRAVAEVAGLSLPQGRLAGILRLEALSGAPPIGEAAAALHMVVEGLDHGDLAAREAALSLEGRLRFDGYRIAFEETKPGRLWLDAARYGDAIRFASPLAFSVAPSGDRPLLELLLAADGAVTLRPEARLAAEPASASLGSGADAMPVALTLPRLAVGGVIDLTGGPSAPTLSFEEAGLTFPRLPAAAHGLSGTLDLADGARLRVKAERVTAGAPAFTVPLRLDGEAALEGGGLRFTAKLADAASRLSAEVEGRHDTATGRGSAEFKVAPMAFAADGLQPGDVFPPARGVLSDAAGRAAAHGSLAWRGGRLTPRVELLVADGAATVGGIGLEGVNGVVTLDGLDPLSTPPGQLVAIARINAGLPLTDGRMAFRIDGGRLVVDGAEMALAEGRVTLGPTVFAPGAPRQTAMLLVEGVDLAHLLRLIDLEGLSATGRLSGTIPLLVTPDAVIVNGGRLATAEPGRLQYRPDEPPQALAAGGESTRLLLQALDDFHYSSLVATLNGRLGGELVAALHLAGKNPALYEGYPIEFNLNLSGRLDTIIDEALTGYRIPDTIRRRMSEFGIP